MIKDKAPLRISHRGGSGLWPENTIEAFHNSIDLGVDGIELDVHLSLDGVLVVHHDEALKLAIARDSAGKWIEKPTPLIKDLTFDALRAYDVGRLRPGTKYSDRYPEQASIDGALIPSLDEVIHLIKSRAKPGFRLYLELKTALFAPETGADPVELTKSAINCVQAHSFESQVTYISFEWLTLRTIKELQPDAECRFTTFPFRWIDPDYPLSDKDQPSAASKQLRALSKAGSTWTDGIDWREQPGKNFAEKTINSIKAAGGEGWFAYFMDVTEETMALANELDLKVSVWTVDLQEDMKRLADLGVEAILTDQPKRLIEIC
jgi:glycerophosphoryl diester phosphodiesterase